MIDFVDKYYYGTGYWNSTKDRETAHQKAFSTIIPLIIDNELTEKQSVCFRYKYISGKSQQEIADLLHLSQPTVSRHINSAKDIINSSLKYCFLALSKGFDEYERLNDLC